MKKVLIISHNPLTTYHNMGMTLLQLFHAYPREKICQIYIYPTIPDLDRCASFFRVTDKDVLNSYMSFFRVKGREIDPSQIDTARHEMYERPQDEKLYKNPKNKRASRMLLRDLMWKCTHWYNDTMKQWLDEQKPEAIFVAPGPGKFLYDIALKISKDRNLPIVTYICDEYYFVDRAAQPLMRLQQRQLQKKIAKLLGRSAHLITICDELKTDYETYFHIPTTVLMTGSTLPAADAPRTETAPQSITYLGNIGLGRSSSLVQIGRTLDELNDENGTSFRLKIYTAEKDESILSAFDEIRSVELCGFVFGEEFAKTLCGAQLLLHTESFRPEDIAAVRHSVSTKIANCLASGVCLIAYAPEQVASVQHLLRNRCAIVCTSSELLKKTLLTALTDENARRIAAENAIQTARKWHNAETNGQKFSEIMESIHEGSANQLRV
ncbi:MAG: hypothetical protein IJG45_04110 [Oscillospiraceae bacterium]|nr:hypothetical protein [Oscillospiraceae bacterium]